jgi:hypothetical protein
MKPAKELVRQFQAQLYFYSNSNGDFRLGFNSADLIATLAGSQKQSTSKEMAASQMEVIESSYRLA